MWEFSLQRDNTEDANPDTEMVEKWGQAKSQSSHADLQFLVGGIHWLLHRETNHANWVLPERLYLVAVMKYSVAE